MATEEQMIHNETTPGIPLIRLSVINPFLKELVSRDIDPGQLLEEQGLPVQIPASSDLFVSALCMYSMVEQAAALANDPYLGATIGSKLDLLTWEPISQAADAAVTVGDLLNRFILNAKEHASSTQYSLESVSNRTTFTFRRVVEPPFDPAQNDAFYLGFMSRLIMSATGESWNPESILITLSDPLAVPQTFNELRIVKGDRSGFRISFPTEWLFEKFEKTAFRHRIQQSANSLPPQSLIESVHRAIAPHIHDEDLTVERAAELCGIDKRRLSRKLQSKGTTINNEIAYLRRERATSALVNSDQRIADIAAKVGFSDPTVFSRAFKNWTGQSPQQYRKSHRD
jgi:AraC-like DNA-binding protein